MCSSNGLAHLVCSCRLTGLFWCAPQILESVIKFRWAALPAEQREGIKNYISNLIIKYSTNEQVYRSESTFINKLNLILVQILKQVRCKQGMRVCQLSCRTVIGTIQRLSVARCLCGYR